MNGLEKIKRKIANGEFVLGTGVNLTDPTVTDIFCEAGFDFIWIEIEHTAIYKQIAQLHVMITKGAGIASFIRVPDNNPALIKPLLDMGADGIVFPLIRSAEDAELAVKACKYPPLGIRGFGPRKAMRYGFMDLSEYIRNADKSVWVMLMIEHIDAVNNLDDILKVPGIDSLVIGAYDLSASMGILGQVEHKRVNELIDIIIQKARAYKIPIGTSIPYNIDSVKKWVGREIDWMELSGDMEFLTYSAINCKKEVNSVLKK